MSAEAEIEVAKIIDPRAFLDHNSHMGYSRSVALAQARSIIELIRERLAQEVEAEPALRKLESALASWAKYNGRAAVTAQKVTARIVRGDAS